MKSLIAFFCLSTFLILPCTGQIQQGEASFYKDVFEGRKTASGELFQQDLPTAAHRTLAFGTIVRITNISNGKTAQVRINDRGPYIRNRVIDVSKSVAEMLDFVHKGSTIVEIEVIDFANVNAEYLKNEAEQIAEQAYAEAVTDSLGYVAANRENTVSEEIEIVDNSFTTSDKKMKNQTDEKTALVEVETVAIAKNPSKAEISKEEVNSEVMNMVQKVAAGAEGESSSKETETKDKLNPEREPELNTLKATRKQKEIDNIKEVSNAAIELSIAEVKQEIVSQIQKEKALPLFFNLNGDLLKPDFYAVQVASLTDTSSALDLGKKLEDFYEEDVLLEYKKMNDRMLYSLAVGRVNTRNEAEALLAKVKERYPYAFILNLQN